MVSVPATRQEAASEASSTELAHQRTDLSINRTYVSYERTLMSWIRTALSMISFGFTIGKLGDLMAHIEIKGLLGLRTFSIRGLADFLVILGTLALGAASWQFRRRTHVLYAMGFPRQRSLPLLIAVLLTIIGAFALTALVMSL